MDLGDEVSVKIKSAIRARLKELGIVWDRELPDYVMVLIANKKSKEQMEKDLMIFLGSHTTGFTAWLHNVLRKLEECTISRGLTKRKEEDKKSKSKRRPSDENPHESKKLKSIDMKSEDNANSSAGSESEEISNQLSPVRIDEGMDSDVSDFSAPTLALSDMKLNSAINKSEISNEKLEETISNSMKSRISEISERDTRLEIVPTAYKEERPKQKIEISWNNEKMDNNIEKKEESRERKDSYFQRRNRSNSRSQRRGSRSKSRGRGDTIEKDDKHISILKRGMKENIQKEQERKAYREESRNIHRRKDFEERKNGYGVKSRLIGKNRGEKDRNLRNRSMSMEIDTDRLPSLVKVTPRPVRHPSMQPSSNLILKAVAEAQKSIATSSLPQPDEKLQKKEEKKNLSRKKVYRKKNNISIFQRENISVTLLNDRVVADKVREEQEEPTVIRDNIRKNDNQSSDGPERFTISLLSDDNDSIIPSDYEEENENNGLSEENFIEADHNGIQIEEPMDISATACAEESVEENESKDFTGQKFDRRRLGPRVIPDTNTVLSFPKLPMKQRKVVQLFLPRSLMTCKCCSQVIVPNKGLAPDEDSIMKTIVNENAYANDIKMDENGKVIKCKFWPSCEAGNDCRFYHPKEYCRTLPNCKYGQKCLYYHPPCKFADKCLNVTCPYTHAPVTATSAVKAKVWTKVPLAPSNGQICMYYPNCTKPFCPYQHSYSAANAIPCKFGINCTKVECEFDHTQQNKNPYKWVAHNPE